MKHFSVSLLDIQLVINGCLLVYGLKRFSLEKARKRCYFEEFLIEIQFNLLLLKVLLFVRSYACVSIYVNMSVYTDKFISFNRSKE